MPDYRRYRVPGRTYFFSVNLLERRRDLLVRHIAILREAVRVTRAQRPFHIDAWVVLPDNLHCIWTLPPADDDFSNRWKAVKIRLVQAIPPTERRSKVRTVPGGRGTRVTCVRRNQGRVPPHGTLSTRLATWNAADAPWHTGSITGLATHPYRMRFHSNIDSAAGRSWNLAVFL